MALHFATLLYSHGYLFIPKKTIIVDRIFKIIINNIMNSSVAEKMKVGCSPAKNNVFEL